jgi:hypothetical protein
VPFFDTPAWTPETPHLEPVVVELLDAARIVLDRREFPFGFRTLAMRDGQVQLNGRPYPLKGVCYVYDSETTGLVMTPEQIETDLRLMKEAGCNAVRCHYPMAEAFFRRLAATIREADPTRLISYAALYGIVGPIADIVDVLGINSYWGWYDKIWGGKGLAPEDSDPSSVNSDRLGVKKEPIDLAPMRAMLDKVLAGKPNMALFLTEFGADSVPGSYSASRALWSENYHADLLREIMALAKDYPQIVGTFPFCFSDYRDPSKVPNGYWNELNLKGLVDYRRNRKLAFNAVRSAYT